jgi:hypothetical protein
MTPTTTTLATTTTGGAGTDSRTRKQGMKPAAGGGMTERENR